MIITSQHILTLLQEEYKYSFKNEHGRYCEIFLNPSQNEMRKIGKELRFLIPRETKNIYIWNAYTALHYEVTDYLDQTTP